MEDATIEPTPRGPLSAPSATRQTYIDRFAGFLTVMIGHFEEGGIVTADDAHAEDAFEDENGTSVHGRLRIAPTENGALLDGWMSFDGGATWQPVQQIELSRPAS